MNAPAPAVPGALPITEAVGKSMPLALLLRRLDDSARRHAAMLPCLPATLAPHVDASPVDATGWTLVAANANVAAKLRHLQPRIEARLVECGFAAVALKIKVRAG